LPNNVEIKARLADVEAFERRVAEVADGPPATIVQHDTFFVTARGRLKLREFPDGSGELIYYERPDASGPTTSDYRIAPTSDTASLSSVLSRTLGVRGVVIKKRKLYRRGRTRIHVDRVQGLGNFMELEVVLRAGQTPTDGRAVADELMRLLGITPKSLVDVAYIDLLTLDDPR
jgi:predicted adenylyl cyclase CyaB